MDQQTPPLAKYRKERDLTLKVVAAEVGVSEGHLSRVEREGTANFELALKLADMTGLPVETFRPSKTKSERAA